MSNLGQKNPYVSRNIGIRRAKGDILCFLDAPCIPGPYWLKYGCGKLSTDDVKIVAGSFLMIYSCSGLGQRVHGMLYLNNDKNVARQYGVPAGNLFVKKTIFEELGLFKETESTGQDIEWSLRAIKSGFNIAYCHKAVVYYPAKSLSELRKSVSKYARGTIFLLSQEVGGFKIPMAIARSFFPMKYSNFNSALLYRDLNYLNFYQKIHLFFLAWSVKCFYGMAMIKSKFLSWSKNLGHRK